MDDIKWCRKCQDQLASDGKEFCSNCASSIKPVAVTKRLDVTKDGLVPVPDPNAFVCIGCDRVIGDHAEECVIIRVAKGMVRRTMIWRHIKIGAVIVAAFFLGFLLA